MNTLKKQANKKYSYGDYLNFPDDEPLEIINGVVYKTYGMAPSPRRFHQEISMGLSRIIANYLFDKKCSIFSAPFDVVFTEKSKNNNESQSVVQPDLSIICDRNKLDEFGCKGAPDWIIEILSPATASKDLKEKFKLYEKYRVKEYWIVEPTDEFILVYTLNKSGKYENTVLYTKEQKAKTTIFEDLIINLEEVFNKKV